MSAVPSSQFIDSVMDIPVVRAALVSAEHTVQKTAETPQVTVQFLEVVDMPVMYNDWCRGRDRAVNCGVPQLQCFHGWLMSLFSSHHVLGLVVVAGSTAMDGGYSRGRSSSRR